MTLWVAGVSFTGFLFLAAWAYGQNAAIQKRVKYEELIKMLDERFEPLTQMRDALLGDMKTEGWISKVRRQQERCIFHKAVIKGEITASTDLKDDR